MGAEGLKVAKWQNAFKPVLDAQGQPVYVDYKGLPSTAAEGFPKYTVKGVDAGTGYDIIDLDDDRFNVWVYDKAKWDKNIPDVEVKISTDNVAGFTAYNDPANGVELVRYTGQQKGPGWYWSDSQMLVSSKVDDVEPVPGVGSDETNRGMVGPLKNGS